MNILSLEAVMKFHYPGSTHENMSNGKWLDIFRKKENIELIFLKFFQIFFVLRIFQITSKHKKMFSFQSPLCDRMSVSYS